MCRYCDTDDHSIQDCPHLTVGHDADACLTCTSKRRRNQAKRGRRARASQTSGGGSAAAAASSSSSSSSSSSLYASRTYWDSRYARANAEECGQGRNEWFVSFEALEVPLKNAFGRLDRVPSRRRVLEVGCGASVLAEKIVEAGWSDHLTAVDFSEACVALMQERERDRDGRGSVTYECMDATAMDAFGACSFDFVFDKGTFDAIVTGDDDNDDDSPSLEDCANSTSGGYDVEETSPDDAGAGGQDDATRLLAEVRRVIAPEGIFVLVSHSSDRGRLLQKSGLRVVSRDDVLNNKATYHCYTCCLA